MSLTPVLSSHIS